MKHPGDGEGLPEVVRDALRPYPLLVVISGPSGVGKDATVRRMQQRGLPFHFVVTVTTRPMRLGEVTGVDYHFMSREQYQAMLTNGELLEDAEVYGNFYGIPRRAVEEALAAGKDVILRIDPRDGARTIRRVAPEAVTIFLAPTSLEELLARLRERKTETEAEFERRKAIALEEMEALPEFDYVVANRHEKLDSTVNTIQAIIAAEKCRPNRRPVGIRESVARMR